MWCSLVFLFFQAEDGIRDESVTGVQTCALPICMRLNPDLAIGGVLLTMVDGRTRLAAQVEAEVRRHFGSLVFRTSVPRSVRLAEAPSHGLPAIAYDRRSAGADAYWKVAMELVERA